MKKCIIAVISCALITIVCTIATICGNTNNSIGLYYDDYVGILASFIGVCTTIIVGFQIASHLDIHDTKKQMESVKAESENVKKDKKEIQEKIEFLETNLSNAFVLVASKSDDNAFKSLAYMTSIYCDSFKNIDAKILLNRYKALFECLSKTNKGEQVALSTLLYKLKNINIPNGIDYYTEIIGLHAEILKTLEEAAKEQNG